MGNALHGIDLSIIVITFLMTIAIGLYFARSQKSSDRFFTGSKKIPAWVIGMSIFATVISSVTFLAYPSAAYTGNWILLVQGLMMPVVLIATIRFIVPLFRRVIRLSTYEYFERRFGVFARVYSSVAFLLTHFTKMGTVLYLLALAAYSISGIPISTIILVVGLTLVFVSLIGGIEAVFWMDTLQGFLQLAGGLICVGLLLFLPAGGPGVVINQAFEWNKIGLGPYTMDFTSLTFIVLVCNGLFYGFQKYGTDQTIVQRYLTAKDDKGAIKATYIGSFISVGAWIMFMLIGSLLFVFYKTTGTLPEGIKAEEIFPHFMKTQLPVGVVGIVLAALICAAFSTLTSDINSISAVVVQDYYQRFKPNCTDKQRLNVGRLIVLIAGLGCIGISMLYVAWDGQGVLGVVFELYAIFSSGIVGIFLLGIFSKRANRQGLTVGLIACILFTAYALLTSVPIGIGGQKQLLLDLGNFNFSHHRLMLGVYSHLIVIIVGYVASLFFKSPPASDNLTFYGYWKELKAEKVKK